MNNYTVCVISSLIMMSLCGAEQEPAYKHSSAQLDSLVKLCECSNADTHHSLMSYIEENKKDLADIARLAGFFGLEKVNQALVEYCKKNPRETFILNKVGKEDCSEEKKPGLASLALLLQEERFFKRSIGIQLGNRQETYRTIDFYVWDTTLGALDRYAHVFGDITTSELLTMEGTYFIHDYRSPVPFAGHGISDENFLIDEPLGKPGQVTQLIFSSLVG